ncbi:MAG: MarR family transcriptional regulator [Alphaproteobacteria bacterium]|nr:MarR family transcriptional regulator [Alphaproteobacteria bacterium]
MARRADQNNALRAWFRLLLIHKTISRKIAVHLRAQFGLSTARFDTLAQLHAAGGRMTMGELSSRLMVTSGNVTGLVDGMVADRFVTRRPHATDRRSIIIAITPTGRKLFAKVSAALARWIGAAMGDMSKAELAQLIALFGKLKQSADKWE